MPLKIFCLFTVIFLIFFYFFTSFFSYENFIGNEGIQKFFFDKKKVEVAKNSGIFISIWVPKNKNSIEGYKKFLLLKKLEIPIIFLVSVIILLFLSIFYKKS